MTLKISPLTFYAILKNTPNQNLILLVNFNNNPVTRPLKKNLNQI